MAWSKLTAMSEQRVYVTYLREKTETNPAKPELLITVSGFDYRLNICE